LDAEHLFLSYRACGTMRSGFYDRTGKVWWADEAPTAAPNCPILLVRGANDGSLSNKHIASLSDLKYRWKDHSDDNDVYPLKAIEIEGGGRLLSLTHPEILAAEIGRFLSKLPLDTGDVHKERDFYGLPK